MANPLFNLLNGAQSNGMQQGGMQQNNIQKQFDDFRRTVNGDPRAIVQNLLNTGKMTQQQYNQLSQMANLLRGQLK